MAVNNRIIDRKKLPAARPKRVILHWTAGGAEANSDDLQHYHLIVDRTGRLVWGRHSIADNDSTSDGEYAAHVRGLNTGSIGVAVTGMMGSTEHPFQPGSSPIAHGQYEIACRVIAELCQHYALPVTERTVLNHGEVQSILGVEQRWKWDVMVLPWNKSLTYEQVGEHFRSRVGYYFEQLQTLENKTKQPIKQPTGGKGRVIALSGLNFRTQPDLSGAVFDVLRYGAEVRIIAADRDWFQVRHDGEIGWVYKKYIQPSDEQPVG